MAAGVLVHQFDGTEADEPWLPCRAPRWCANFGDRLSVSLLNARLPYTFKEGAVGMVLSSTVTSIRCSFFADGGTMTRMCPPGAPQGCVPGCSNNQGQPDWCRDVRLESQSVYGCAFRPNDLEAMLRHHEMRPGSYNEVIVDHSGWRSDVPNPALEAIYFISEEDGGRSIARGEAERRGREIHAQYRTRFPDAAVPLVRLKLGHGDLEKPFTRVA